MGEGDQRARVILTDGELTGTVKVWLRLAQRRESGTHASKARQGSD